MTVFSSFRLSWSNVKTNKLRTVITIIIMALGIFALILIITSIEAASNSLTKSFSTMGGNSFSIRYKERFFRFGQNDERVQKEKGAKTRGKKSQVGIPISYEEARLFKQRYSFPGTKTGIVLRGKMGIVVNTDKRKTDPEINVIGGDENYLELNGYEIAYGRNLVESEINSGMNVCMIGSGVAALLFPGNIAKAVDGIINVDQVPYRVVADQ